MKAFSSPFHHLTLLFVTGISVIIFAFSVVLLSGVVDQPYGKFMGWVGLISAIAIFLPRLLFFLHWHRFLNRSVTGAIEGIVSLNLAFNSIGSLGSYYLFSHYDTFLHAIVPFDVAVIVSLVLGSARAAKGKNRMEIVDIVGIVITLTLVIGWEIWEYAGDRAFGTDMFGQIGEPHDTVYDITAGIIGILCIIPFNHFFFHRVRTWLNTH